MSEAIIEPEATVVVAVQNDPQEPSDNGEVTAAVVDASVRATEASVAAETATEASVVAAEVATTAEAAASAAAEVAYSTRHDLQILREEMASRDASFRSELSSLLDERFGSKEQRDEPTEVVVKNDNSDSGAGDNSGSSGSAGSGADRPTYRHRFGRR